MNKTIACRQFVELFNDLKESEKTNFSRISNKLLGCNYITKRKERDANDYLFIVGYKELFTAFFWLINFDLEVRRETEVVYIKNEEHYNHLNLKKDESILLLVIRLLYQRKKDLVTLDENVEITVGEIHDELTRIGFVDAKRIPKERLKPVLKLFKSFNIVDYLDKHNLYDDSRVKIYPTILHVIDLETITEIIQKVDIYLQGGDSNEEISQD